MSNDHAHAVSALLNVERNAVLADFDHRIAISNLLESIWPSLVEMASREAKQVSVVVSLLEQLDGIVGAFQSNTGRVVIPPLRDCRRVEASHLKNGGQVGGALLVNLCRVGGAPLEKEGLLTGMLLAVLEDGFLQRLTFIENGLDQRGLWNIRIVEPLWGRP